MEISNRELIDVIVAVGGFITAVAGLSAMIGLFLNHRSRKAEAAKVEAEAAEIIGRAWAHICDELQEKLQNQEQEIKDLRARVEEIEREAVAKDRIIEQLQLEIISRDKKIADLEGEMLRLKQKIADLGGMANNNSN